MNTGRQYVGDRRAVGVTSLTGIVTELSANGFGFISPDRGGGEFWFRQRANTAQPLAGSDPVEFDVRFGQFCPEAVNVRRPVQGV